MRVHTTAGFSLDFCDFGSAGTDIHYLISFDDTPATNMVINDYSCFVADGTAQEETVTLQNKVYDIVGIAGSAKSANGYTAWESGAAISDVAATHDITWKVAGLLLQNRVGGNNVFWYGTTSDGAGGFYTDFGITSAAAIDYNFTFGGQSGSAPDTVDGRGFLATSNSNVVAGNFVEVYCFYETAAPISTARSNQLRLVQRLGSRFADNPETHPLLLLWDQIGVPTSIVNNYVGLTIVDDIYGFIGPYWYDLDQPDLGSNNCVVWGGALRIKAIEGETGTPNIRKLILYGGSNIRGAGVNKNFKTGMLLTWQFGGFWISDITSGDETLWSSAALKLLGCGYSSTAGVTINNQGIMWTGGVASIAEPWLGWNKTDPALTTGSAPLLGQIPNCIIPWRGIGLSDPPSPNEIFYWDGRLWRYNQVNTFTVGSNPKTSMAYNVSDSRVFNGTSFTGLEMYDIASLSVAPTSIANGGSAVVTITAAASQDLSNGGQCVIRCNNQRIQFQNTPDHLVTFTPGSNTATVT
ncbi:MAG: hypothetical protein ACXABY_36090, partial [Candidatus Thorarchaeota archaeon]